MEYKCSVCDNKVEGDLLVYVDHTEQHVIEEIKRIHPEWVEEDGICKKCEQFFRDQLRGES